MEKKDEYDLVLSLEDIFVNLRLISKIEVGNKLIQDDRYINIDNSYVQSLSRYFKGVNRNDSLKFINIIYTRAFQLNDDMISNEEQDYTQLFFRLTNELNNSINGLNNLKQTYSVDKLIQAEIDVLIENIRAKVESNSKNFNFGN